MQKTPVAAAVMVALMLGIASNAGATDVTAASSTVTYNGVQDTSQITSSTSSTDQDKKKTRLDAVEVSGSLINNAQIQTATPTYTISAQDIKARGFNSVTEVLQNSVFATGAVQGNASSGGFTQGAQTVSMYGLNPEYTLTLIDGKPITQFGQLYNGDSNFTDISNIPLSMIERIDIIPGGGSSIYGSQAIAGVVNIITKQHMDGVEVDARAGGFSAGGGASQRLSLSFGKDIGKLNVLGSFEFFNQSPIWAYQRSFTANSAHPSTTAGVFDYGNIDNYTGSVQGYISPPDGCSAMSGLFGGSVVQTTSTVASRTGTYCGSTKELGYTTEMNQTRSYDGMLKLRYDLNDHVRLYSDVLLDAQTQKFTPGSDYIWWGPADLSSDAGLIEDAKTGDILYPERVFAPEEVGGNYYSQLTRQYDLMYQADVGANGTFGESNWNWDVYFLRSGDRTSQSSPERLASKVDGYFNSVLGEPVGYDSNTGLDTYSPNWQAFFTPLTPAQYASFSQNVEQNSNTWVNNARATITNDSLFHLPGGDAGFAVLMEGGSQAWYEPVSPLVANGDIWGLTGTSGGGTRNHYASAFELNLPVFKPLTIDLSGRYDHYALPGSGSDDSGKFTFKAGVEYRPIDSLLIRGNYATSFLAPDMSALYLGPSGNYQDVTDYYTCQIENGGKNCAAEFTQEVEGTLYSNKDLKPTTAKSWTAGFVWAPLNNMSFSADFLHIAITNEVAPQSADLLMKEDSQCLLGTLAASSGVCQQVLGSNGNNGQVVRDPLTGQVTGITQYYVNISNEVTDSVTSEFKYTFNPTPVGTFGLQFDYNDMLKHMYQIYPGSTPINQLTNPLYSSEFKSIVTGALNWSFHDKYASTLYWHRYGPSPNYTGLVDGSDYPGAGRVDPWIVFNFSFSYTPMPGLDLTLMINNLFNKMPPSDPSYTAFPYYNSSNYNVYGREIMLQADYRFGGAK